jgi:integrase
MEKRKARIITTKLALEWATLPPDRHASWALRLSDVRGFARHVANFDPRTETPPVGMLPGWKRAKPYVYSDAEIDALLTAALALPPEDGLRRWTYHTLFGLIAVTGMRISEAMGLEGDDVDLDAGMLTVRLTKFGKSRLVPLHPTTCTALRGYAARRDAHLGSRRGSTFFVAEQGGRLLHQYVHRVFWRLSREIGLRRPGDHTGPRVHDFRHRFAIRTLLDWYREGKDVEQQLPLLSTYLGHALRANDVETITYREFTLEGRGRNIPWLCLLSLMRRLLRQPALKLRMAGGRRLFQRRLPRRLNSSCARVAARLRPRRKCASSTKRIVRQAFLEGSGRSCAVRGSIRRPLQIGVASAPPAPLKR